VSQVTALFSVIDEFQFEEWVKTGEQMQYAPAIQSTRSGSFTIDKPLEYTMLKTVQY